ncbi:hypothetical protein [Lacibacter sediminis]|uniref:Lipoprotein n=1 Tax=Lacibacter sediminis TaxID=2760713 RepID=A0A7G5XFV2_9BACT|nr:hypothetical protein [Lacibacter sediminis]QNA44355.1 hypothetical protein H4075_20185 [Lacibacter sediminis]
MKKILFFSAVAVSLFIGCEKNADLSIEQKENEAARVSAPSATLNTTLPATGESTCAGPYNVVLESVTGNGDGTYTWTWSVQNPKPGNGTNGTIQNLSHWDITLGSCVTFEDVVSGATSTNGTDWTTFTPSFEVDNSFNTPNCNITTVNVLKFNLGTTDAAKSYYRLTIDKNVDVDPAVTAYYKSGATTKCGTFCFPGFGCEVEEGCSFSQGYWFAKPGVVWPDVNGAEAGVVTIGGQFYTEAEGRAIWNTSNAGGISDAKKGFLQVAAILLSDDNVLPAATVWADVTIVQNWLSTKPKLSADGANGTLKVQPKSANSTNAAAGSAAGRIGDWINLNHCD